MVHQHGKLQVFAKNAEERDRHHSSWLRFPWLATAVVEAASGAAAVEPTPLYMLDVLGFCRGVVSQRNHSGRL